MIGPNSSPSFFIARKFSPLSQSRSTVPPSLPPRLLRAHPGHGLAGVGELDLHQLDPEPLAQLGAGPDEIIVDLPRAAPGIEVDGLPARPGDDVGEFVGRRRTGQPDERHRDENEDETQLADLSAMTARTVVPAQGTWCILPLTWL